MCPERLESEDGGQGDGAASDGCHVEGRGGASAKQVTVIWPQYKYIQNKLLVNSSIHFNLCNDFRSILGLFCGQQSQS